MLKIKSNYDELKNSDPALYKLLDELEYHFGNLCLDIGDEGRARDVLCALQLFMGMPVSEHEPDSDDSE